MADIGLLSKATRMTHQFNAREGELMPSTSPRQHRFMEAIAHSPTFAKQAGVPQSVGKDFAAADDKAGITKTHGGIPVAPRQPKRTNGSSPASAVDHMRKRRSQGVQLKGVAREFGTSKSTAHRKTGNMFRQGYVRGGSAAD